MAPPFSILADTFNPANLPTPDSVQLQTLGSIHAKGLSSDAFWKLFVKCAVCENFMTKRSVEHHVCPDGV